MSKPRVNNLKSTKAFSKAPLKSYLGCNGYFYNSFLKLFHFTLYGVTFSPNFIAIKFLEQWNEWFGDLTMNNNLSGIFYLSEAEHTSFYCVKNKLFI